MSAFEIASELFFVERGYLSGNHFVYRSENAVLIDTGYIGTLGETERLIRGLGVDPESVGLIINTHCHCDHVGSNRAIQERSGCSVAMHSIGKHFINTGDDWSTWWSYYDQKAEFFTCTSPLEDGDTLSVGPHQFDVMHTPGHSADSIVLYNRANRILISSDTLWENDMPVVTLRVEGSGALFALARSLEKIEGLDVKIVYPGHGKPFTDFTGAIARTRKKIKAYMEKRERVGEDLLKKIFVYTILMAGEVDEESFFSRLMGTHWFKETVDLDFNGEYRVRYEDTLNALTARDAVRVRDGKLTTTVKP